MVSRGLRRCVHLRRHFVAALCSDRTWNSFTEVRFYDRDRLVIIFAIKQIEQSLEAAAISIDKIVLSERVVRSSS